MEQTPERQKAKLAVDAAALSATQMDEMIRAMGSVAADFGITISPSEGDRAEMTILGKPYTLERSIQGSYKDGFITWLSVWDRSRADAPREVILFSLDKDGNTDAAGATKTFVDRFGNLDDTGSKRPKLHNIGDPEHVALMCFAMLTVVLK